MPDTGNIKRLLAGIFDEAWYLENYPDVAVAGVEPLDHYLSFGADEGRDPHLLFDTSWYIAQNPDVERIKINPLLHYVIYGASEGRDPHPLFDSSWYLENNGGIGQRNPLEHYLTSGATEARAPHPLFDLAWYLERNPDVALFKADPLSHYLLYGEKEGRNPNPLFDVKWYAETNPSCSQVGLGCLEHYIMNAGSTMVDPHPLFSSACYIQQLGAERCRCDSALEHYIFYGARNKFDPHPLFDAEWYLAMYPEVSSRGINPLIHYLEEGAGYGTEPHPLFKANWYKNQYMQYEGGHLNPLVHYVLHGSKLNYSPSPTFSVEWYTRRYRDVDSALLSPLEHYVMIGLKKGYVTSSIAEIYKKRAIENRIISQEMNFERRNYIAKMCIVPKFFIVIDSAGGHQMDGTLSSICNQNYKQFEIINIERLLSKTEDLCAEDAYLIWLEAGDTLSPLALYHFSSAINQDACAEILYGDEEVLDTDDGVVTPFYKPAWSPEYLESFNYIGRAVCYKISAVAKSLLTSKSSFELLLQATEAAKTIVHLREIVLRSSDRRLGSECSIISDVSSLNQRAERMSWDVEFVPALRGARVYEPVLSANHLSKLNVILFDSAATSDFWICSHTDPNDISDEILDIGVQKRQIIDIRSVKGCCQNIEDVNLLDVRPIRYASLAEALNAAASQATGEYILFLDEQYRPHGNDLISSMIAYLKKPHVGAAGPIILSDDDRIVAFGQILCDDLLQDVHYGCEETEEDYFFSSTAVRNFRVTSLNGLTTTKLIFEGLHGFDRDIRPDLIAADYCLRLADQGLNVVCTPSAKFKNISGDEAVDRGSPQKGLSADPIFFRRWSDKLLAEPYYNEFAFSTRPAAYDGRPEGFS